MPAIKYFVDSNVLLYSVDIKQKEKRQLAIAWLDYLWRTNMGRMSWHVLHEFYANAVRKIGMPAEGARKTVTLFCQWRPGGVNQELVERAWHWMARAQLTYWDGLILASAERAGCPYLLSEDFQDGRAYESVQIINPFLTSPPADTQSSATRR